MKCVILVVGFILICVDSNSQVTYNFLTFGDTLSNNRGSAAIQDEDGNVFYAGTVSNGTEESDDIFFCKIDPDGNIVWQFNYGSDKNEFVNNMIRYDDNYFVICGDASDAETGNVNGFLLKVDATGNQDWLVEYGFEGMNEDFYGITKLTSGEIAVTGFKSADAGVGNDVLVARYTPEGSLAQKIFFGEDVNDYGMGILEGENNSLIISGDRIAFGSAYNAFIAKINADGDIEWDHMNGFDFNNGCKTIIRNSAGNIMLVGESAIDISPVFNIMVSEIDTAGNFIWTNWLGEAGAEAGYDICEPAPGNYFITGFGYHEATMNNDILVMHIDGAGNEIARKYFGGTGVDYAYDVKSDIDGHFWVSGFSNVQDNIQFALIYDSFELVESSVTDMRASSIQIFPNPAEQVIHIKSNEQIDRIQLCATDASLIATYEVNDAAVQLNLPASLPPAIYLLTIYTRSSVYHKKIIVK